MDRDLDWLVSSFEAVDRVYFDDAITQKGYSINWQTWDTSTCFIYGKCYKGKKLILVNRILAHDWVPVYVVIGTIYHEMLHVVIGNKHNLPFKLAEDKYIHFNQAQLWESLNYEKLLNAKP